MDIIEDSQDVLSKFDRITNRVLFADYMMPFGKYEGEFMAKIAVDNPEYLMWLYTRATTSELRDAIQYHLKEADKNASNRSTNKRNVSKNSKRVQQRRQLERKNSSRRTKVSGKLRKRRSS